MIQEILFREYAKKWKIEYNSVRMIFLLCEFDTHYAKISKFIYPLIKITPRELRYFYKKIILTQQYGNKKRIGKENYKNVILNKS